MLDVHAKTEFLQDPPLRLDHLVLQRDVGTVQDHRLDRPVSDIHVCHTYVHFRLEHRSISLDILQPIDLLAAPDLFNVLEHVDDVPGAARALLDLAG